ncbi:low-density lipoprotein receptor-related protein 6 [Chrysoperla carnea]|uniref:low-density lipoprotein receptor-related protein 6 n=1 Tax=Chrysoperla carnea TaxID=189513 RepID=UPI001D071033|nr:low-density lipoprotein receptor-related protein 6 [Chrysoperla carnea]
MFISLQRTQNSKSVCLNYLSVFNIYSLTTLSWIVLSSFIILFLQITTDAAGIKSPPLIIALRSEIRLVNASRKTTLVKNLLETTALDIDYVRQRLCWADHSAEAIQCVHFNGTQVSGHIQNISARAGPISAEGLAIDWYTGNLYWTDGESDTIEVANSNGSYRKVLYWTDIDQPRAIVLVPMKSLLFWTDWGEVPKIERASMNGNQTTRQVIVSENIYWPNGMTVDYETEQIYWLDGKYRFIAVMDYDGKNRKTLISDKIFYPFGVTYYDNSVYWTDWSSWSVHIVQNVSNPVGREVFHCDNAPMAIHVWSQRGQPKGSSPCQTNNGGCSHLCLLSAEPPYYNCACPTGILLKDQYTCYEEAQNILLFAQRTFNSRISLDTPDYTAFVIPLKETKHTIALDFDPVDNFLYWTDDELKAIRRAKLDGSEEQDIVITEVNHPDGIAVDWIARNIYWTDSGYDRIEVARLNGSSRKVIINEALSEPRAIVVAPVHGWLFWTDWAEKNPKIERSSLDGSERIVIVSTDLGWPNGLALDLVSSKVYWGDANKDKIEVVNMDGTDRRVVTNDNLPHMFGLSLLGDYLYWTDWQRRSIDRVHKVTGKDREVISEPLPNIMGVKAVHLGKPNGTNPCAKNNGGCSHLCLNRPHDYTCACQIGHELGKDNKTCVIPEVFLLFARKENIGRISIENGNTDIIPVTGVKNPKSLDFDIENNRIYWTDIKSHSISRAYLNGSDVQKVLELGVGSPEGMAVDWVAHNVYWTNAEARRIEVARLDGSSRRTLVWKDLDTPTTIVVDPGRGFIYWSEQGEANRITRASMDGTQRKIIIHQAGNVQGMALDYESERIFWGDRTSQSIKSSDFMGRDERTIVSQDVLDPFGLTLYKEKIFWSDRITKDVEGANKYDGTNRSKIVNHIERVDDLLIYHSSRQTQWNTCAVNNGDCKHLCFAVPSGAGKPSLKHECGCPTHYKIDPNNNSCIAPEEYLIFSQKNMMSRLLPDTLDCPDAVLPFQAKLITAIEYDPVTQFFYWIEGKFKTIRRTLDDGTHASTVVRDGLQPFDLALDPIGRLLFWSDEKDDLINVTRLNNGSAVGVVVKANGVKPRHIAVHPTKRLLFWIDVGELEQVCRARIDGSEQRALAKGLVGPTALTVDPVSDRVYWSLDKMIYISDLNGTNIRKLYSSPKIQITGLAVLGSYIYWIDSEKQQIERADKLSGQYLGSILSQKSQHLTDLIAVRPVSREVYENHTCSIKNANGKCSHLCIWSPDNREEVCACPPPLILHVNKQTCLAKHDCGAEYFTCAGPQPSSKECIPATWRCDGQSDCPDDSDEHGCPDCEENQFKCQSGQCIDKMWVCDGTTHCPDGNDEARCCDKVSDFQCPSNGVCISVNKLCDGWENCADGADESEALCSNHDYRKTESISNSGNNVVYIIAIIVGIVSLSLLMLLIYHCHIKLSKPHQLPYDQAMDPLSPPGHSVSKTDIHSSKKSRQTTQTSSGVRMSMLSGSLTSNYDRSHITGASSSTNGSGCYPRETLNPPPSPATTAVSTRADSSVSRYRPYRHYRTINQPPPPTPCSTDVCDESDSNYHIRGRYEPFPPPPTPRSHCHTESCPPSPSSRSSTNFSPFPPPPSPVPSPPRGYDS